MSDALLTIIVPTYNRASSLELLLRTLHAEIAIDAPVRVLVSDNASTDETAAVIAKMCATWAALMTQRHDRNIGPDGNFCSCVDRVDTRYFWIIGDDDLPKRGVVAQIVAQLLAREPALLYMQSEWINPVLNADQGEPVGDLLVATLDSQRFAEAVHVWVTFISGMVIDKQRLRLALGAHTISRFDATHLVQLGWVLPLLASTGPFLFVSDRCLLATKDNTGGYGLLTVFGVNFTRVVNDSFGATHPLARALVDGNMTQYLPGLIWGARAASAPTTHVTESPWPALHGQLGSRWLYWMLLVPLGRFPRWLAQPFFQTWRVLNRLRREWRQRFGAAVKGAT